LNREVAVKLVHKAGLGTEGRSRLLLEAQMVAQLNHPNIVTIYDAGEMDDTPYIVMEYVGGHSLYEKRPESLPEIVEYGRQICAALEHAHNQGIVHRDLKPENVVVDPGNRLKLMDFGLAQSMSSRYTGEGVVMGTVFYLAPEQALGGGIDPRADLYSLGVILYELATGELPFIDDNPVAVISQHLHAPVVPPRARNAAIPPALDDLIVRLMSKEPRERPASAAEVRRGLEDPDILDLQAPLKRELSLLDRIIRGRLVGREQEVKEAISIWRQAAAGKGGQTLLISGEPGIGKTRLLREVMAHAEVSGGQAHLGSCYQETNTPYSAFGQIVRKALRRNAHRELPIPDPVMADLLVLTPGLRVDYPHISSNPPLDPQSEQGRLFENVVTFLKLLSEHLPILIAVDDLHWADSGTLSLLRHLARRTQNVRVLLLGTYREVELDEGRPFNQVLYDLNRERLSTRLKLQRLDQEGTRGMLAALFDEEITQEFLDGIHQETEGNPFFIEEICKALVEAGGLYLEEGRWGRLSMEELEIPQSVRVAIQSRVGKLPPKCQDVLRMAAILGREFDYETLSSACDQDEDTLIDSLEAAEKNQLIEEVSAGVNPNFSFAHALIPATLRDSVSTLRRRRMHHKAASAIEDSRPEDYQALAYHYSEAGDQEQALTNTLRAGEQASRAYANQEAEAYFHTALDLEPSDEGRAEILAQLGEVIVRLDRQEEGIGFWQEAADLYQVQGRLDQVARCYARMGRAWWWAGDSPAALEYCQTGIVLTEGSPESKELANLIHETARAYYFQGDSETAEGLCNRSLEMARKLGARRIEADSLITYSLLSSVSPETAKSALEEAIQICQEENFVVEEARAHNNLAGVISGIEGASQQGLEQYHKAAALYRKTGNITREFFALANLADMQLNLGNFQEAGKLIESLDELKQLLPASGRARKTYLGTLVSYEHQMGNLEKAADLNRELFDQALKTKSHYQIVINAIDLAVILFDLKRLDEAEEVIKLGIQAADQFGSDQEILRFMLASVFARKGDPSRARQVFEEGESFIDETSAPFLEVYRLICLANVLTAEGKWEEMETTFSQVAAMLEGSEMHFFYAWVLRDWAEAHIIKGGSEGLQRGKTLLNQALHEFKTMGSEGFVEMIQARLKDLS
jgi:tetratricopeptide (TPR) repeat protein